MKEIWKIIEDYPNYKASNLGRIKSIRNNIILKPYSGLRNYLQVCIRDKEGKQRCPRIHRLIAKTFIPNPENKKTVNHINGNKIDNSVNNLEWATNEENMHHAAINCIHRGKLNKEEVAEIRKLYNIGIKNYTDLARMFPKVSSLTIKNIIFYKCYNF